MVNWPTPSRRCCPRLEQIDGGSPGKVCTEKTKDRTQRCLVAEYKITSDLSEYNFSCLYK